jgi:DNA-directed RNA polymerase specialized sigma24 family protein
MTREAYGQLYQAKFRGTVRFLRSRGASREHSEDAAQAAWLEGLERCQDLFDEGMVVLWVTAVASKMQRDLADHESHYQALPDLYSQNGIDLASIDAARTLELCRPRDRALLEQKLVGFTLREIARQQGVSATAIRIRFERAFRATRANVEERAIKLRQVERIQQFSSPERPAGA